MQVVIPIETYRAINGMDFESNGAASVPNCALAQATAQKSRSQKSESTDGRAPGHSEF